MFGSSISLCNIEKFVLLFNFKVFHNGVCLQFGILRGRLLLKKLVKNIESRTTVNRQNDVVNVDGEYSKMGASLERSNSSQSCNNLNYYSII